MSGVRGDRRRFAAHGVLAAVALALASCGPSGTTGPTATRPPPVPATASRSPTTARAVAAIDQFAVTSFRRVESSHDPKAGAPIYVVDGDARLHAHAIGVRRLDIFVSRTMEDTKLVASAAPDASGNVDLTVHLPEPGVVYLVQASGVTLDQTRGPGCVTNPREECVVSTPGLRVRASP